MTDDIKSIKSEIISIYEEGGLKADAARYIMEQTGLKTTASKDWARRIYNECYLFGSVEEEIESESDVFVNDEDEVTELDTDLEYKSNYIYNKSDDQYVFLLEKRFGKNIILTGDAVRSIIKGYSNYDGDPKTINQVALRYNVPRNILIYILKVLGCTHDSLPVTNEEYDVKDIDQIKGQIISDKKFALYQKLQKDEWSTTREDALKWNQFVVGKYNPFLEALDTWNPAVAGSISLKDNTMVRTDDKTFLCVLTDTHIGELTKHSWEGKVFNTQKAVANIINYISQIENKVNEWTLAPTTCRLLIMGDILNSCVDGMTRKGTKLHNDIVNGDVYKVGLDVIIAFVTAMRQIFPRIDISCVNGNHDSFLVGAVYYSASRYFEDTDGVYWHISDYWLDNFKINNVYFMYSHGKDDVNHVGLPRGAKFESFVQSLLLKKIDELVGVQSKYFISGHLHSFEHIELNDFEKIQVPSLVTADAFAEGLGYMTKARQNCFLVGQNHIEDTLHFYFD